METKLKYLKRGDKFLFTTRMQIYKVDRIFRARVFYTSFSTKKSYSLGVKAYGDMTVILP